MGDWNNNKIRKIIISSGQVTTITGTGSPGFFDGTSATSRLKPANLVLGPYNMLYIADADNHRIRCVNAITGEVTTIAGSGTSGNSDNTNLLSATFNNPRGIAIDKNNILYVF